MRIISFVTITLASFFVVSAAQAHSWHHRHHHYARHHEHDDDSKGLGHVAGMNRAFVAKLEKAFSAIAVGSCRVGSGYRSYAEQARLHAEKPGLAARPGHSNHERGLAADLNCEGSGLSWLHRHAAEYGLVFPISYESWHIEPTGVTRFAGRSHRRYAMRHRHVHYAGR
jgi:hypothetical protein